MCLRREEARRGSFQTKLTQGELGGGVWLAGA